MTVNENKLVKSFLNPLEIKDKLNSIEDLNWDSEYSEDSFMIYNLVKEYILNRPELSIHKISRIVNITNQLINLLKE